MSHIDGGEPAIEYSVRDLFERVDVKLDDITHKLDSKANQADLDALRIEMGEIRLWRAARDVDFVSQAQFDESKRAEAEARELALAAVDGRLNALESWRSWLKGAGAPVLICAGALGAAVVKVFLG